MPGRSSHVPAHPRPYNGTRETISLRPSDAGEAREAAKGDNLLEQMRDLNARTLKILEQAETAGDLKTALAAIRETRANQELIGRIVGEFDNQKSERTDIHVQVQSITPSIARFVVLHGRYPSEQECRELGLEEEEQSSA